MAEAEDVILDAAERTVRAVREAWRRGDAAAPAPGTALADVRRRLTLFVRAALGREWPLVAVDPPPAPTWLRRVLGAPPPWRSATALAAPSTDGAQLFLPRRVDTGRGLEADLGLLRVMALGQAARLARGLGPGPRPGETPLVRDLRWLSEAAALDAWLAAELPGLAPELAFARRFALERRPPVRALGRTETAVEAWTWGLLRAPLDEPPVTLALGSAAEWGAGAARLARALDRGDAYRGVAPVPGWGQPRAPLGAGAAAATSPGVGPGAGPRRSWSLPRRLEARDEEPQDARSGPFMAYGEPQLGVQDPAGLRRPPDHGEEEDLEALAGELPELEAAPRVRAPGEVPDALPGEDERRPGGPAAAARPGGVEQVVAYPEWVLRSHAYRPAHVHLREREAERGDPSWVARVLHERRRTLTALRRAFEGLRPRRTRRRGQADGDEVDLEAWVSLRSDRRAGAPTDDRVFVADRPARRDVAVALLVDASGSTDGHVAGGRRVIDVAREAALCFCEALGASRDQHAVWAFTGRGPRDVRLARVKGWAETLGAPVRERIAGLSPGDFTRLGGPVRHVTASLTRQPALHRLLVILTDGRPNDEDEYAGEHGLEDVRMAVLEARLAGVHPFALTIDPTGSEWLPRMFGPRDHAVLLDASTLPERLTELYRGLTRG